MGKRKHKDCSDDYIRRKIRRLQSKLDRDKDRNGRLNTRSSSPASFHYVSDDRGSSPDIPNDRDGDGFLEEDYREPSMTSVVSVVPSASAAESVLAPVSISDLRVPGTSSTPVQVQIPPEASSLIPEQTQTGLSDEILEILGQAKSLEEKLGEKISPEISERWGKILLDGLAKEQKQALKEKMLIPENFLLVRAPKLNPEVSAVLSEPAKNRDKRLEYSQNQLGSGIAGLVNLTNDLIQADVPKIEVIKKLSEVSQLLLDLHYEETLNRRKLVLPLLDKGFWNTTHGVKRKTFLFGDELGETIKNSKDIERSSQQIKKPSSSQNRFQRKPPVPGNSRFPPRPNATKTIAPPHRYYEPQPSTSTGRGSNWTQPPPPRQHHRPPPNKSRDRRRQ